MSQTLKEKYQQKRIVEVQSKLKKIDNQILESNVDFQVHLLMEALDENEYKEATEVIEKLTKLNNIAKNAGMILLSGAIDKAVKEINNFTGGTGLSRFKGRFSSLFSKTPAKNPILAGIAMVSALESGFKILPTVLKNNIPNIEDIIKKEKEKKDSTGQKLDDLISDKEVKKNIENNLLKAFVPSGIFGKVVGTIPGIDNTANLIADIFKATPQQLDEFSKVLNAGVSTDQINPNLANPKEAGSTPGDDQAKKPAPEQQKKNIQVTQDAAKKAGISDGKALLSLFDELGYKLGSFEGSLVVPELQKLQRKYNIPDDQTDGFTRGLMVDFEKDFKAKLQDQIKKEVERIKKEQEKPGTEKAAAPAAGAGSQLGGALGAG